MLSAGGEGRCVTGCDEHTFAARRSRGVRCFWMINADRPRMVVLQGGPVVTTTDSGADAPQLRARCGFVPSFSTTVHRHVRFGRPKRRSRRPIRIVSCESTNRREEPEETLGNGTITRVIRIEDDDSSASVHLFLTSTEQKVSSNGTPRALWVQRLPVLVPGAGHSSYKNHYSCRAS